MQQLEELFPTYLLRGHVARAARLNRELKHEIEILSKIDRDGVKWSKQNYRNGYSSYGSMTHLHRTSPHFGEMAEALQPFVNSFVRRAEWDLQGRRLEMTTCWANRMGAGAHHTLHLHPRSVLSGVYFVDCPNGSSVFKIEDPRMDRLMAAPPRKSACQTKNRGFIELRPKAGDLLLFESWLKHEVPPNQSRAPRLSVSFNYEW